MALLRDWSLAGLSLCACLVLGCGGGEGRHAATPQALGPEASAQLEQASRIGRAIFEQDEATAHATDALVAADGGRDSRVQGWITKASGDGWITSFVTGEGGAIKVLYEVRLAGFGAKPTVAAIDPPRPIDPESGAMFRAQRTAASAMGGRRCAESYNPVVLPGSLAAKDGWLVYFLAASSRPDALVLAGHHRVLVSADGSRVLEHTPLSKSCLVMPRPSGANMAALVTTSLVGEYPSEAHVFTSLHYRLPLFVAMANGTTWNVDGDRIAAGPRVR
jgi:hypothetical protein